jgi:hypothetical protein
MKFTFAHNNINGSDPFDPDEYWIEIMPLRVAHEQQ